jgi:hypothetical protein
VQNDGWTNRQEFTDEGYGRDDLARPGLDRVRDLAAQGKDARVVIPLAFFRRRENIERRTTSSGRGIRVHYSDIHQVRL